MTLKKKIGQSILFRKMVASFFYNELLTFLKWKKFKPLNSSPHGHFYSPVVSKTELTDLDKQIWEDQFEDSIPGIELNKDKQTALLKKFSEYYRDLPFSEEKSGKSRYYYENISYAYTDAILLYSFIRHFKPNRIIEIGSGFSSAVMLDTRDLFCPNLDLTFIDPYPKSLLSLLRENDSENCKIVQSKVQHVKTDQFSILKKNDFLFIDSSHVTKTGSDVNYEIFKILPSLNAGVLIHFHDIFYPFEYPKEWAYEGRNWNESYLLRAFLSYNKDFEIVMFADYIHKNHSSAFGQMPLTYKNSGGSLWIRKN
jgi:predicted O-methyltransferase YrrM